MKFHTKALAATALLAFAGLSGIASAEITKMVGGAPMYPGKNIIQNAVNSKDNTTLVAAVKAAGLVDTLQGPGPFTVFAPTNAAFAQLPAGTVDSLLKPDNKEQLTSVLTYHVLPGRLTTADLKDAIKNGGGEASFKTVQGEPLTVTL
ncbi:MAG TPA: fasciclin domain-containing protein, partial [Methylocella sp.]|nr:fasciclin domain-containing protein [Methylocella sp.]